MTTNDTNTIHFGPGKLGLGFVIPNIFRNTSSRPVHRIVSARYESPKIELHEKLKKTGKYHLILESSKGSTVESIEHLEVVYLDSERDKLIDYIAAPQTILITTAVGSKGMKDVAQIIAQGVEKRVNNGRSQALTIIACENPPLNSITLQDEVIETLEKIGLDVEKTLADINFRKAIVDRICPSNPSINSDGIITVPVERFSEWIVLSDNGEQRIKELIPSIKIVNSEKEFEFLEKRKAWLVNSTHIVVAFFTWYSEQFRLQDALGLEEIYNKIKLVQEGFVDALFHFGLDSQINMHEHQLDSLNQFADNILCRLKEGPEDTYDRILGDWIQWGGGLEHFRSFFSKVVLRIGDPIGILIKTGTLKNKSHLAVPLTELLYLIMNFMNKI